MMASGVHKSHKYRQARQAMFALYGDICHICGHAGAGEADHVTPYALDPDQPVEAEMLRPAHGGSSPCPVCKGAKGKPRSCNQERGKRPLGYAFRPVYEW